MRGAGYWCAVAGLGAERPAELVVVGVELVDALARGGVDPATNSLLTPYLVGDQCRGLWRMRSSSCGPGET